MRVYFYFSPTPLVDWVRIGGDMPDRAHIESYGQELVIDDIEYEDGGTYECQGINTETQVPVLRSFSIAIECEYKKVFFFKILFLKRDLKITFRL